ncbi:MAG: tetratricopeptide repeat protein [Actinobacteria bacterium]|nr:tetratricopeptide repeat protein [Actinomycetota bacterium]
MSAGADDLTATWLDEEREFLLRSIEDLDRERAEGNLDDADYQLLRDEYTARAAAVLGVRSGDGESAPEPPPDRTRWWIVSGVVVFAVVAAVLLARSLGERLPGDTVTGNEQIRNPLSQADELLARGEAADALRLYDEAAAADPGDAEPRAKAAFVVFNAGLVDEALSRLQEAELADPAFADTYFFRALVLVQGKDDPEGARAALARYLELAPEGQYAEDAQIVLDEIDEPPTEEGTP